MADGDIRTRRAVFLDGTALGETKLGTADQWYSETSSGCWCSASWSLSLGRDYWTKWINSRCAGLNSEFCVLNVLYFFLTLLFRLTHEHYKHDALITVMNQLSEKYVSDSHLSSWKYWDECFNETNFFTLLVLNNFKLFPSHIECWRQQCVVYIRISIIFSQVLTVCIFFCLIDASTSALFT